MTEKVNPVTNVAGVAEQSHGTGAWLAHYKELTPTMRPRGGMLGLGYMRVPPGHVALPFHYHAREDEVFYILSGRGVLRYGEELFELKPGDCVSCPAGTKIAHQIANPYEEELQYLAIGNNDPDEVCGYPDSGKVMVRSEGRVGYLEKADYMAGEPAQPKVLDLIAARNPG